MNQFRVVHLTLNIPGPLALSRLAREGASVTKVEPPTGDPLEGYYPGWYRALHQAQKVLRLDLKESAPRQKLDELLSDADLFVTSLRPLALKRLHLDESSLRRKFPSLQLIRIVGYPAPNEETPAHDLTCQAEAGLLSPPTLPRALVADYAAAERVFSTCLLALLQIRSNPGSSWTVAMSEMAEEFATPCKLGLTAPQGALGGALPHYNIYEASDGWIAVAALEPHFLKKLLAALGLEKPDHGDFKQVFRTRTQAQWLKIALDNDIPLCPVK